MQGIALNKLSGRIEVIENLKDIPWDKTTKDWKNADRAHLRLYLDREYKTNFYDRDIETAFSANTDKRSFNPIQRYFQKLPNWDKTVRAETTFIKYLGAKDSIYTREVTLKTLIAAMARTYYPGVKYDSMLVLVGPTGNGKSTLISKLAINEEFFSDSLRLSDIGSDDTKRVGEKIQGFFILEIGELAGMKKVDFDKLKNYLSSCSDDFRPAYGRATERHPRQCIFIGTSNNEDGFLRDLTGSRRFLPIHCPGTKKDEAKSWNIKKNEVDQIWAEVKYHYDKLTQDNTITKEELAHKLDFSQETKDEAERQQNRYYETDERQGKLEAFLDLKIPKNWDDIGKSKKREYVIGNQNKQNKPEFIGTEQRTYICISEILEECFGIDTNKDHRAESMKVSNMMRKVKGWEKAKNGNGRDKLKNFGHYGRQRYYSRIKE